MVLVLVFVERFLSICLVLLEVLVVVVFICLVLVFVLIILSCFGCGWVGCRLFLVSSGLLIIFILWVLILLCLVGLKVFCWVIGVVLLMLVMNGRCICSWCCWL